MDRVLDVGYHGCGYAIFDIESMTLVQHEDIEELDDSLIDNERYFEVDCSCWCIIRTDSEKQNVYDEVDMNEYINNQKLKNKFKKIYLKWISYFFKK